MLGPILAAIIIILLVIYAAFPFLTTKGFKGWAGIALTSLILFTVIVTLFVILGQRKGQTITLRTPQTIEQEAAAKEDEESKSESAVNKQSASAETQNENNDISDEEALMILAKEYIEAEEAFKAQGNADYQQKAAQQIIDRYDLNEEDWQAFLEDAAKYDLFNKAKAEM